MRTAYKAWSGIATTTFVLVAAVQCSTFEGPTPTRSSSAAASSSSAPTFAPTGYLASFTNAANLTLTDGRGIHVPMLNGVDAVNTTVEACDAQVADDTVRALLSGKTLALSTPRTRDARSLVPAGYVEADVTVEGRDYAAEFEQRYTVDSVRRCHQPPPTTYADPAPASSGSDIDVDVDSDGDRNHRDGAATGGFCRRRWWC